ncbi:phosphatidyl serine synthase domain-containing protein [Ditylenchus destructor]|uniref:Phosphatidylserine synthase n=1 Tax=Ditylenchus destructor TaxID=166010 RepID=A0AAD4R496_9BILA|nr:phosphatidyl serine synthase domain-containing protein [Ditylenchus destructor]
MADIHENAYSDSELDDNLSDGQERSESELRRTRSQDDDNGTENPQKRKRKFRNRTATELERLHFRLVNEKVVEDITVEILYKPHTLTVLVLLSAYLFYKAFTGDDEASPLNIFSGLKAMGALFLIISAMAFPNVSVLYAVLLQFTLYQSYADIKTVLTWLDPVGLSQTTLDEKDYAINCSDVSLERIWGHMDIFAVGHFLGWGMKALLIRHTIICWYISIAWELTEVVFAHLLPNFQECWWDAIFLDIILCNGLGIAFGTWVCKMLEMRQFHWESIKNIRTTGGKFKRAVLQFTPESWMKVEWHNIFALRRSLAIYAFIMVWLISELNTFFLKHVFSIDTKHPVVFSRIILIGLISAPSIRQYYVYATDPKVKRIGMQCWVYAAVCVLESAICVKFGRTQLPPLKLKLVTLWILFLAIGTIFCIWLSMQWAKYSSMTKNVEMKDGETRQCYLDSSYENLGMVAGDVKRRRKQMRLVNPDST